MFSNTFIYKKWAFLLVNLRVFALLSLLITTLEHVCGFISVDPTMQHLSMFKEVEIVVLDEQNVSILCEIVSVNVVLPNKRWDTLYRVLPVLLFAPVKCITGRYWKSQTRRQILGWLNLNCYRLAYRWEEVKLQGA